MNDPFTFRVDILGYWGAFPKRGGATCGVLITTSDGQFLLDCGGGVLSPFFQLTDLTDSFQGVLFSHLHFDHMGDIGCLHYAISHALRIEKRTTHPYLYAPATPEPMWTVVQYPLCQNRTLHDGMQIQLAGATITVKKVNHTIECYAFRIEKDGKTVVYYTDTTYDESHWDFLQHADLLICEATMSLGTLHSTGAGHMSDIEAGKTATGSHAKRLCLYHLPSDGHLPLMQERAASVYSGPVYTPDQCSQFVL